jgi:hypothetical protein
VATSGSIPFNEIAYELSWAQGMQLIWDYKMANGENQKAVIPDIDSSQAKQKDRFKKLLG